MRSLVHVQEDDTDLKCGHIPTENDESTKSSYCLFQTTSKATTASTLASAPAATSIPPTSSAAITLASCQRLRQLTKVPSETREEEEDEERDSSSWMLGTRLMKDGHEQVHENNKKTQVREGDSETSMINVLEKKGFEFRTESRSQWDKHLSDFDQHNTDSTLVDTTLQIDTKDKHLTEETKFFLPKIPLDVPIEIMSAWINPWILSSSSPFYVPPQLQPRKVRDLIKNYEAACTGELHNDEAVASTEKVETNKEVYSFSLKDNGSTETVETCLLLRKDVMKPQGPFREKDNFTLEKRSTDEVAGSCEEMDIFAQESKISMDAAGSDEKELAVILESKDCIETPDNNTRQNTSCKKKKHDSESVAIIQQNSAFVLEGKDNTGTTELEKERTSIDMEGKGSIETVGTLEANFALERNGSTETGESNLENPVLSQNNAYPTEIAKWRKEEPTLTMERNDSNESLGTLTKTSSSEFMLPAKSEIDVVEEMKPPLAGEMRNITRLVKTSRDENTPITEKNASNDFTKTNIEPHVLSPEAHKNVMKDDKKSKMGAETVSKSTKVTPAVKTQNKETIVPLKEKLFHEENKILHDTLQSKSCEIIEVFKILVMNEGLESPEGLITMQYLMKMCDELKLGGKRVTTVKSMPEKTGHVIEQMEKSLKVQSDTISFLSDKSSTLSKKVKLLEGQLAKCSSREKLEVGRLEAKLISLSIMYETVSSERDVLKKCKDDIQVTMKNLDIELQDLRCRNANLARHCSENQRTIEELKSTAQLLKQQLDIKSLTVSRYEEDFITKSKELMSLNKVNEAKSEEIELLKSKLEQLQTLKDKITEELQTSKSPKSFEEEKLAMQVNHYKEILALKTEKHQLSSKIDSLCSYKEELESHIRELNDRLLSSENDLEYEKEKHNETAVALVGLEKALRALEKQRRMIVRK